MVYSWSLSHASGIGSLLACREHEILPQRVLVLPIAKKLARNAIVHLTQVSMAPLLEQNHCFALLSRQNGNRQSLMAIVSYSSRNCQSCTFISSLAFPQNRMAYTIVIRPVLISKFASQVWMVGPTCTLEAEGADYSRRVFCAISCERSGAKKTGSGAKSLICEGTTRGRILHLCISGLSTKSVGKLKPVMHYLFSHKRENTSR